MSKKFAVHEKAVVLILNKAEAKVMCQWFRSSYMYNGVTRKRIEDKLRCALEEVGESPASYGLTEAVATQAPESSVVAK